MYFVKSEAGLRATVLRLFNEPSFVAPLQIGSISNKARQIMSTAKRHRGYYRLLEELKNYEIVDQGKQIDNDDEEQVINIL